MTDYTDPSTIDVDEVIANITQEFHMRGDKWTSNTAWPHVTVKALADEIIRLRGLERIARALDVIEAPPARECSGGFWLAYYGDFSAMAAFAEEVEALRYAVDKSMMVKRVTWGDLQEQLR